MQIVLIIILLILWSHSLYRINKCIQAVLVMKNVIKNLAKQADVDGEQILKEMGL